MWRWRAAGGFCRFLPGRTMSETHGRSRFVLITLLLAVCWNFASSLAGLGWVAAYLITFCEIGLYVWFIWRHRDPLLGRMLLFALAAGWTELLADRWLVEATATLVYLPGGPFVVRSPLYMPFAWTVVLTQLGYLGWWLGKRYGLPVGSLLVALFGAVNIPLYEQWAKGAGWWYYRNSPMLGNTPWYIIAGEFFIVLALPKVIALVEERHWSVSIAAGIGLGLWIWGAYGAAFAVVG